jgi:hypothetical protein
MAPPSPLFSSLATELLDHICSFIHSPRDLLSLALCERRLSAIIIPSHIQFRILVCRLQHQALFAGLLAHPALSSRFVSLELIGYSEDYVWPASLPHLAYLESEWPLMRKGDERRVLDEVTQRLVPAVRCLVGLVSFRCNLHNTGMADRIFTALQDSCPSLSTVELVYSSYSGLTATVSQVPSVAPHSGSAAKNVLFFFLALEFFESLAVLLLFLGPIHWRCRNEGAV